jgi:hypothetical protein
MILIRGGLTLEFFPHPELDPALSWFSCCLRVDDLAALYQTIKASGARAAQWPTQTEPTMHRPDHCLHDRPGWNPASAHSKQTVNVSSAG